MSVRKSEPSVAIDVNASWRLCASGTCLPVRYGESKSESEETAMSARKMPKIVSGEAHGDRCL